MHSSGFFWIKLIARLILKREISGSHTISDQSLLLSTIVLNDKDWKLTSFNTFPMNSINRINNIHRESINHDIFNCIPK